MVKISITQNNT